MRAWVLAFGLTAATGPAHAVDWNMPESRARWADLSGAIFGEGVAIEKTDRVVRVEAPGTAADAALVPVTLSLSPEAHASDVSLVIDQNPAPLAAKVRFGSAGDGRQFAFRVRADGFTNMHAVAATGDGRLVQNAVFVKGAGGCSAPWAK